MRHIDGRRHSSIVEPEPPLSNEQLLAMQEACAPVGLLTFPPTDIIRSLRQYGYIEIVLGGVQITPSGLERLLRERKRGRSGHASRASADVARPSRDALMPAPATAK